MSAGSPVCCQNVREEPVATDTCPADLRPHRGTGFRPRVWTTRWSHQPAGGTGRGSAPLRVCEGTPPHGEDFESPPSGVLSVAAGFPREAEHQALSGVPASDSKAFSLLVLRLTV